MNAVIAYMVGSVKAIKKIVKHRIALAIAGRRVGISWQQILKHDNSKFSLIEFRYYVEAFELGIKKPEHATAWEHHWRNNPHHIEYWIDKDLTFTWCINDCDWENEGGFGGGVKRYPSSYDQPNVWGVWIPDKYIREMIADWMAASYAYSGMWPVAGNWEWGNKNLVKMLLKIEHAAQPEASARGLALQILRRLNMITDEQYTEANII